jgi:hypothetical protein
VVGAAYDMVGAAYAVVGAAYVVGAATTLVDIQLYSKEKANLEREGIY